MIEQRGQPSLRNCKVGLGNEAGGLVFRGGGGGLVEGCDIHATPHPGAIICDRADPIQRAVQGEHVDRLLAEHPERAIRGVVVDQPLHRRQPDVPLVGGQLVLSDASASTPMLTSTAIDLATRFPELAGKGPLRIEIGEPSSRAMWALVSVTNNETQHVTVIAPH